jgi:YbbR-like protein
LAASARGFGKITFLLANLRLKLLAIAFAVALWSVVAYAQNPTQQRTVQLPVAASGLPGALVVIGKVPPVPVTVIGTADNLSRFLPASLHVTGNFSNVKVGMNKVPVDVQNTDPNITIVAPSSVIVNVDESGSSTQTVSIERVNTLPAGFHEQTAATTITPATVRVDGPKSQLSGIQAVVIVDLANVTAPSTTAPAAVHIWNASKKDVPQMTVSPPTVSVKMVLQADAVTLNKGVGFTITGQPATGYRMTNVQIAPLEVQATGLQNTLAGLVLLGTDPVDITGQKSDVIRTVTIRPPDGVTVNQKTATVHVFISPIPGASPP